MSKKRKNGNGLNGNNGYNESWINGNGNCRSNGYGSICSNGSNGSNGTSIIEKRSPTKTAINITAKTPNQKLLFQSIRDNTITIVCGPAGTGKTKISVVCGLYEFIKGNYKKMIFTRPCVEANGENLGFLPGDLNEKINPYMYPIFDFLSDYLSPQKINYYMQNKEFVTLPLAFQRGMTFHDSFVILDECLSGDTQVIPIINGRLYRHMCLNFVKKEYLKKSDIRILSYNIETGCCEFKKLVNFFDSGKKKIIELYFNNRRTIPLKSTSNHPFAIIHNGKIIWKEASELRVGDSLIRNCNGKKNNSILLNSNNYDIILGFLLGDGSLSKNASLQKSYRLRKTHGMKQYNYMLFCMNLLRGIERYGLKSGYTGKPLCGFSTKSLHIDKNFIDSLYSNGKKKITLNASPYFTDRSLALFYMDDGHIVDEKNYSYMKVHTEGFSYEENMILKSIIDTKYRVDTKVEKYIRKDHTYYYLRFNKDDSRLLFEIIKEYIYPDMYYKLPEKMRGFFNENKYIISNNFNGLSVSIIESINIGNEENVYNMEIEDNNNYFANNILVHNCQNTTPQQVRMFLTRIGENCKVVITGDPDQSDIRGKNGLVDACERLEGVTGLGIVRFTEEDIVRSAIVAEIEQRYNDKNKGLEVKK